MSDYTVIIKIIIIRNLRHYITHATIESGFTHESFADWNRKPVTLSNTNTRPIHKTGRQVIPKARKGLGPHLQITIWTKSCESKMHYYVNPLCMVWMCVGIAHFEKVYMRFLWRIRIKQWFMILMRILIL